MLKRKQLAALTAALLLLSAAACGRTSYEPVNLPVSSVTGMPDESADAPVPEDTLPEEDSWPEESEAEPVPVETEPAEINIRPAAWEDVTWTLYECPYFTVEIPEGWVVTWDGNAEKLGWTAEAPAGTYAGISNIDHMNICKSQQTAGFLGQPFWLENGTVQEYMEKMYSGTTENFTVHNGCVPANKDEIQALRPDKQIQDYQALYATFYDSVKGSDGEGIFSAVVMEAPDVVLTGGINYAMWEVNGTLAQWAEAGRLVDWAPVLAHIVNSFTYTDYYIQEWMAIFNAQWSGSTQGGTDPDPVMEAFEERMKDDTIVQEKYSDMIGEYERVYDTENDKIYRAYNGFLDDLGPDQNRFTSITDDQYAEGYAGWIDK
ncbi:MAG: hypothetical protein IKN55_00510 [Oscillospiraceae bacterium]|nr:hypothetical protein [Oscillospiraceae bacterium]